MERKQVVIGGHVKDFFILVNQGLVSVLPLMLTFRGGQSGPKIISRSILFTPLPPYPCE